MEFQFQKHKKHLILWIQHWYSATSVMVINTPYKFILCIPEIANLKLLIYQKDVKLKHIDFCSKLLCDTSTSRQRVTVSLRCIFINERRIGKEISGKKLSWMTTYKHTRTYRHTHTHTNTHSRMSVLPGLPKRPNQPNFAVFETIYQKLNELAILVIFWFFFYLEKNRIYLGIFCQDLCLTFNIKWNFKINLIYFG